MLAILTLLVGMQPYTTLPVSLPDAPAVFASQPNLSGNHNYADHYAAAQRSGRMVVLVSADYCYACQTCKAALNAVGEPYAIIDVESATARELLGDDRAIPQTFLFERQDGTLKKSGVLRGSWDIGKVREFLGVESPFKPASFVRGGAVCAGGNCSGGLAGRLLGGWRFPLMRAAGSAWQNRPRLFGGCLFGRSKA